MVSVASGARWCAQVAAGHHCVVVHTTGVLFELACGNSVLFDVGSICMAARTGLRDIEGVNFRTRVAGRPQVMHPVAIRADRHFCITLREQFPVDAGLILAELIGSQRRVVLPHEGAIGMTTSAQGGNLAPLDLAAEPGLLAHGIEVRLGRVAAMATGAGQSFLRMNVPGELFFGYAAWRIQRGVAIKASVRSLCVSDAGTCGKEQQQRHPFQKPAISPCSHR